jgi:hypothetical protein
VSIGVQKGAETGIDPLGREALMIEKVAAIASRPRFETYCCSTAFRVAHEPAAAVVPVAALRRTEFFGS